MNRGKGSQFERAICKLLSRWWTDGKRDDVFWRSSQSGGRATERAKKALKTFGSYGDIMAVDPIGQPLTAFFTIELKRGSTYTTPGDLLDFKPVNSRHKWVVCLLQAIRSHEQAESKAWMMICKRDHRAPIVYLEARVLRVLCELPIETHLPIMRMTLTIDGRDVSKKVTFMGLTLEDFLREVKPEIIRRTMNTKG